MSEMRIQLSLALHGYTPAGGAKEAQPPRGEYVLIVEGAPKQQESGPVSEEEALMRVQALLAEGLSRKDAVRQVAAETGLAKNQLYDAALRAQHTETE